MTEVIVDGAQNVGVGVGTGGILTQLIVAAREFLHGLFLVAEDLDDLLTVHHFFDVAVHAAQRLLLRDEVFARLLRKLGGSQQHENGAENHNKRQPNADRQHRAEDSHNGDHRGEYLRNALRDHLAQGIGIVGVVAHNVAMSVTVEITDGQSLHMREHIVADFLQRTLRNDSP